MTLDAAALERYEIGQEIGRGSFSIVFKAVEKESGDIWAIKSISKKYISKQGWINLSREVEIMLHLKHPNILRLRELIDTSTHIHLVLEYMDGGELFNQVVRRGSFGEKDASKIIKQVLEGINYLHKLQVAHRDLKPENLLCSTKDDRVVVADFGLAKVFSRGELLKTHVGTPHYAAPEIIRGDKTYDNSCDMWSIGVISYVLLAGCFPFHAADAESLRQKIINAEFSFPDEQWSLISVHAKEFIKSLLVADPKERLTAEKALEDPWIQGKTIANTFNLRSSMESFTNTQRSLRTSDIMVVD